MARAYSQDLRIRALNLILDGMLILEVSKLLKISRPTLYKWKNELETTGSTQPKKRIPPQMGKIKDLEKFQQFVDGNSDKIQEELAQLWGNCSRHTIGRVLKKISYTRKKTYCYIERDEEARNEFKEKIKKYEKKDLVYIDESGIDNNESYDYGYSPQGTRLYGKKPGKGREKLSIIGGLCQNIFLALFVYKEYCTAKLIVTWLEKQLLPQIEPGKIIIMDNAAFHNSGKIREVIEKAGCELLYLPIYSPDLNPIEHW